MAQSSRTYFATSSTYTVKRGPGTAYGLTIGTPIAGGTVVVADLADLAVNPPNLGIPSTFGPSVITSFGPWAASPQPADVSLQGRSFSNGLLISVTSTQTVTVHFD